MNILSSLQHRAPVSALLFGVAATLSLTACSGAPFENTESVATESAALTSLLKDGLHPCASDLLRQLGVKSGDITQTVGNATDSAGLHKADGKVNGAAYTAATDISVSGRSNAEIRDFLEQLGRKGFAAWYRHTGDDGWNGATHVHAVFTGVPMKDGLKDQVADWLVGKNGLVSHTHYGFYTWSNPAIAYVRALYDNGKASGDKCSVVAVPPANDVPDGTFLREKASGEVYVAAGGAPLYVASSALIKGTLFDVDASYIAKMNAVPRDGTFISGAAEVYVVVGGAPIYVSNWANVGGAPAAGVVRVDDAAIQGAGGSARYSHLRRVPSDGSFITDGVNHEAYVIVGGAPIYVTNWTNIGGSPSSIVKVDGNAIGNAGAPSGRYGHLNAVPADGAYLQDGITGETFVTVGGAPVYISAWANVGNNPTGAPVVKVDGNSLALAGTAQRFNHINRVPADGAYLQDGVTGETYVTVGGAPIYISAWANVGNNPTGAPVVKVDGNAIIGAGAASGRYSHLNVFPADGSFFQDGLNHEAYVVAGGAPLYITSWNNVSPPDTPLTNVDGVAIGSAGAPSGRYRHLRKVPADGSFLRAKDGTTYRIEGGAPIYVSTWNVFSDEQKAQPVTPVDATSIALAASGPDRFAHLNVYPSDGTRLLGSSGNKYVVQSGKATPYSGSDAFPQSALVDQFTIDHSPGQAPFNHLM
jgi:hypothetical protein